MDLSPTKSVGRPHNRGVFFEFRGNSVNLIACFTLAFVSLAVSLFVAEAMVRLLTKYELIDSLRPFGQYMNYSTTLPSQGQSDLPKER